MKDVVAKYIQIRDFKEALDKKHKEKMETLKGALSKLEAVLLAELNAQGLNSASCDAGTCYKTVKTRAGILDWDATLKFIQDTGSWEMLYRNVSKDAVAQYRDEHQDIPPGIEWREEVSLNVRRS